MAALIPFGSNYPNLFDTGFEGFYNLLDDFFADSRQLRRSLGRDAFSMDIKETEKEFHILADLPGVKKEEVQISEKEGRLVIKVEQRVETENKDNNYICRERKNTSMARAVFLGDVDSKNITAKLEDGVLSMNVPKKEKVDKTTKIEIK